MTGQEQTIQLLLEKARRDLANARSLLELGGYDNAIVLAYYGAFHAARSLLLSEGMEPKTHSGLLRLLSLHFVRTDRMAPETANLLTLLESQRARASYDATAVFTKDMAAAAVTDAANFLATVEGLL